MKPHDHDSIEAQRYNDAAFMGCVIALAAAVVVIISLIAVWTFFFSRGF
jgi:hypothetical protein